MTGPQALHRYLEASALAYADRGAYLADPAYVDVPVAGLLSPEFAARAPRADRSDSDGARPVAGRRPAPLRRRRRPPARVPTIRARRAATTHLTVADAEGNVVSYTFTIEQIGGNAIVVPATGSCSTTS